MTKTTKKTSVELEIEAMLSGITNDLPSTVKSLPLAGSMTTPQQVEQLLQGYDQLFLDVSSTQAAYKAALVARKAQMVAIRAALKALRAFVVELFPADPAAQAKFGIVVKPRAKPSVATKAVGLAKGTATRAQKKLAAASAAPATARVVIYGADGKPIGSPAVATAPVTPPPGGAAGVAAQ
jgi:hypothetical protein